MNNKGKTWMEINVSSKDEFDNAWAEVKAFISKQISEAENRGKEQAESIAYTAGLLKGRCAN